MSLWLFTVHIDDMWMGRMGVRISEGGRKRSSFYISYYADDLVLCGESEENLI